VSVRAFSPPDGVTVAADALHRFIAQALARAGLADADAATVADMLAWASLRGVDTHGVARLPQYVRMIRAGEINAAPRMSVAADLPALAVLDADHAPGAVAMTHAMRLAMARAGAAGIAAVLVRDATHTGALGCYAAEAARAGFAAIAMSASTANMAYHGARAAGVSTNPIAIAVPGGDAPLVLDMSTGFVSLGRILAARRLGEALPPGVAIDREGRPATDPHAAAIPLPLGGPKGSGLSLMIECLTSLAVGNPLIAEALEGTPASRRHRQNALAIAIDLAQLGPPEAFRGEVERLVRDIKALPADPDAGGILMPGERGDRVHAQRSRDGVPLPGAVHAELAALAAELGIAMPA
jgi:LDH2 family malate/lactate/ureidoglycolate dehydrogenase